MSNEFKGADLRDAVRKAAAAYDGQPQIEAKSFCEDIRSRYDSQRQEMDRIFDRMVDLQREADGLRREAALKQLVSLATAAALAARALGNAARIADFIRKLRLSGETMGARQSDKRPDKDLASKMDKMDPFTCNARKTGGRRFSVFQNGPIEDGLHTGVGPA